MNKILDFVPEGSGAVIYSPRGGGVWGSAPLKEKERVTWKTTQELTKTMATTPQSYFTTKMETKL
jgi:hypothetical protein